MKELVLPEPLLRELEEIYFRLQQQYARVAAELDFSCEGCPDNCCDSYFLHYTYAEWAYLWRGVRQLSEEQQHQLIDRARRYLLESERAIAAGRRPEVMCPLNEKGLCLLYKHRLLVCRTHGVPATLTRPDGQALRFPGCFRCQEVVAGRAAGKPLVVVERTAHLRRLAHLENRLLENRRHLLPKIRMTIAEMLVKGPPKLPLRHCERPEREVAAKAKRK
ncbi:MAG: hypothetical protein ACWGOX_03745 [Desulforhopalus sp.]